jgi:hypothetical protein
VWGGGGGLDSTGLGYKSVMVPSDYDIELAGCNKWRCGISWLAQGLPASEETHISGLVAGKYTLGPLYVTVGHNRKLRYRSHIYIPRTRAGVTFSMQGVFQLSAGIHSTAFQKEPQYSPRYLWRQERDANRCGIPHWRHGASLSRMSVIQGPNSCN